MKNTKRRKHTSTVRHRILAFREEIPVLSPKRSRSRINLLLLRTHELDFQPPDSPGTQ